MRNKLVLLVLLVTVIVSCSSNQNHETARISQGKPSDFIDNEIPGAMTRQIREVLDYHEGDVLFPGDVKDIDLSDISKGTIYEYRSSFVERFVYKYSKNKLGLYYFDLITHVEGEEYPSIFRTNGHVSEIAPIKRPNDFLDYPSVQNKCKYLIGSCEYSFGRNNLNVVTGFSDGVWTVTRPVHRLGIGYLVVKNVYDKNGMMLYRGTYSNVWASGEHSYIARNN